MGNVIGIYANGYLTDKYGHKKVLLASYIAITFLIFIVFFSPDAPKPNGMLVAGELLCGIPWGIFATLGKKYLKKSLILSPSLRV